MILISVQNTERTLTNSGGTIRPTPSLETRSSSQKRRGKGRSDQPKVNKVSRKLPDPLNDHSLFLFRFKDEVAKALESFVEKEDEFIKQVTLSK